MAQITVGNLFDFRFLGWRQPAAEFASVWYPEHCALPKTLVSARKASGWLMARTLPSGRCEFREATSAESLEIESLAAW